MEFLREGPVDGYDSRICRGLISAFKEWEDCAMNKDHVLMAVTALLISIQPMMAQHQHGGGAPAGGGAAAGGGLANISPSESKFQRAIALQATETQSLQVRSWIQSTTAVRMQLEHLKGTTPSGESRDLLNQLEALKGALEGKEMARSKVLAGLSERQRSELKKDVKKLEGASRALAGAFADLNLTSADAPNRTKILKDVQRALEAITIEQHEQQRLADEMGVTV